MSVCRRLPGYCDVYMYPSGKGQFICCTCSINHQGNVTLDGVRAARAHLVEHQNRGDLVPQDAFTDLLTRDLDTGAYL